MRSAKRKSSRRRTSRRLRRNDAPPPAAKPSNKKLLIGGIGVVAIGGIAAYALTRSSAPQLPPPGPPPGPGGPTAAQCDAIRASLLALRASANPDAAAQRRLETQLTQCIAALRQAGGEVDNATSNLSDGDGGFQHIEDQFADYKRTDYSDALKRNNIRQDMLNTGASMASSYASAATAATDDASRNAIRASIIRALDSATNRRICYQYDQPGCGRFGVNEDHGNDKAAQEYARVIKPLLDAHALVVGRLQSAPAQRDNENYAIVRARPALAAFARADAKFDEYKGVDYADALRRNNLRQEVLGSATEAVNVLGQAVPELLQNSIMSAGGVRALRDTLLAGLRSAYTRWICYLTAAPGCDRFGVNEDASNDKATQEWSSVIVPLQAMYAQVAGKLLTEYSEDAYAPYVQLRLSIAKLLGDYVAAKWGEYKNVNYADPVRRNNIRGVLMVAESSLASFLSDTMSLAVSAANDAPVPQTQSLRCPDGSTINGTFTKGQWVYDRQCPQQAPAVGLEAGDGGCTSDVRGGGAGRYNVIAPAGIRTATGALFPGLKSCAPCFAPNIYIPGVVGPDGFWVTPPGCADSRTGIVFSPGLRATDPCPQGSGRDSSGNCVRGAAGSRPTITVGSAALSLPTRTALPRVATPTLRTTPAGTHGFLGLGGYVGPAMARHGLGQVSAPTDKKPTAGAAVQAGYGPALVKQVAQAIYPALDASVDRWGCFLIKADGCDKSGDLEPDNWAKADWELANVITPLLAALDAGMGWLSSHGDKDADLNLTQAKLKKCSVAHQLAVAKWDEFNATASIDFVRRNNQADHARAIEQRVLDCINSISPRTPGGAALVANTIQAWKTEWRSYPAGLDDSLARFRRGVSGLGDFGGMSTGTWVGIGVAAFIAYSLYKSSQRRTQRNKRRRRCSSHRLTA